METLKNQGKYQKSTKWEKRWQQAGDCRILEGEILWEYSKFGRRRLMRRKINISEMPPGKSFEDYADDTIFVLDDSDDENWEEEENEE